MSPEQLLEQTVKQMADHPDKVSVESHVTSSTAVFDIRVDDSDVGKVLGKRGSHADALRIVFGAIYGKHGKRLLLQVIDPRR